MSPSSQSSFQTDPNSKECLLAIVRLDTAENEPCKDCPLSVYRLLLLQIAQVFTVLEEEQQDVVWNPTLANSLEFVTRLTKVGIFCGELQILDGLELALVGHLFAKI